MHPIMEMRPLAALENYVDVMRDTPSSYIPLDHRFRDLLDFFSPSPFLPAALIEVQVENSFLLILNS